MALPGWWPLALCVLLGMAGGAAYGLLKAPQYTATSYVAVVPGKDADPTAALGFAQAYGRIATGGAVLAGARADTDAPVSALRGDVQAVTSPDAPLIEITGTAARAARAADISNAVADSLTRVANRTAKRTEVKLTVFAAARAPSAPSSPSTPLSVAVGGCTGVLCGGLLLLVRPARGGARRPPVHVPEVPAPGAVRDTAFARQVQRRVPVKDLRKGASGTAERP